MTILILQCNYCNNNIPIRVLEQCSGGSDRRWTTYCTAFASLYRRSKTRGSCTGNNRNYIVCVCDGHSSHTYTHTMDARKEKY